MRRFLRPHSGLVFSPRSALSGEIATTDTPRFTFGIIEIAAGREVEAHVHKDEDDAFYILEGEMTFVIGDEEVPAPPGTFVLVPPGVAHGFRNNQDRPVRMLNIHAPAGFDRRVGLTS